jgi:hypothetical protein
VLLFFSLSVQHTGPFAVVVCQRERATLLSAVSGNKWDTVFLDANGYDYCMWPRLTDINGSNYIERLCTTITIGIKSPLKVLLLDKIDGTTPMSMTLCETTE